MKPTTARKLHRRLGLIFCLSVLMSAGSGVLHQIMSRTQPPPPQAQPSAPIELSGVVITPRDAELRAKEFLHLGTETACTSVNIRMIGGLPWYQLFFEQQPLPVYVQAMTGVVDTDQDGVYAGEIASRFLGGIKTKKTDYLTHYNAEYINIFRILPVYRFDAEDGRGTRVYVSTSTGSVTRHTDNARQWEANLFSNFHKLMFIPFRDVRDTLLVTMTGGIALTAIAGILLFFKRPRSTSTTEA